MSRIERLVAAAAVAGTLICCPVRAGDLRFDPTVDLSVYHDGNVDNVDKENTPDEVARLGLNLNLALRNPSSSWAFAYRPFRELYNDFSERDYTGHNASVRYARTGSARTSLDGAFSYSRTERPEFDPLAPDTAYTYTDRSTFEAASLRLGGSVVSGRRSSISWGTSGRMTSREDTLDTDYNDSQTGDLTAGWSYRTSERSALGTAYAFQVVSYDRGPSTDVHTVSFTQNLTVGRNGAFDYGVGLLRGSTGNDSSTNASVNAAYRWTTGLLSSFSFGARQGVSEGTGVGGATLDRGGYVTWIYTRPRGWGAGATLTYWDRSELNPQGVSVNPPATFTLSDNFSWPLGRSVRVGLFHNFRSQRGADSNHSFGVNMNWALLGERRTR